MESEIPPASTGQAHHGHQITSHEVNPANRTLLIEVVDGHGSGGAHHEYDIRHRTGTLLAALKFQNGPVVEQAAKAANRRDVSVDGVNGITQEALIAIVIDRLEHFQAGPYACHQNKTALEALEEAQMALHHRTEAREARGVEGTNEV